MNKLDIWKDGIDLYFALVYGDDATRAEFREWAAQRRIPTFENDMQLSGRMTKDDEIELRARWHEIICIAEA